MNECNIPIIPSISRPTSPFIDKIFNILDNHPAYVVDIALQHLQNAGLEPVEWRALLYSRMNVPIHVANFSYVVPDDDLESMSAILEKIGLPYSPQTKFQKSCNGDFSEKGRFHRITKQTSVPLVQHIILYPMSFTTLLRSELTEEQPFHVIPSTKCTKILVPRQSAVYASLIRMMLNYPRCCTTRTWLASDLSELIGYNLMGLLGGYVDAKDEDLCKFLEIERRVNDSVHLVRSWGWDREWRDGEEWFGEALAAVISGTGDIRALPHKSPDK